jgi:hypothetical protein
MAHQPHHDAVMRRHNGSMRTTIDMDPKAHKLAKAIARQRNVTLSRVVNEVILDRYAPSGWKPIPIGTTDLGLPALYVGRPVTAEEVEAAIEEE